MGFDGVKKSIETFSARQKELSARAEIVSKRESELKAKEKDLKNLNETEAGHKALELDAADGKKDGRIEASVWNAYAEENNGKKVKKDISVFDAMNSITTYTVKNNSDE